MRISVGSPMMTALGMSPVSGNACMSRGLKLGNERQDNTEKSFHVAGAAAVEPPVALDDPKRIGAPFLAVYRHDVGVSGQNDPALAGCRADARHQVRLGPIVVEHKRRFDTVALQVILDEADELQVGFATRGVETHQGFDHLHR
jgi:hypothetical protein